jgi:hypothetical protein
MSKKIWLKLIDIEDDEKDKSGPFSNAHFIDYLCHLLKLEETGERFLSIQQCQDLSADLYAYLASNELPNEIDDAYSMDKLGRAYAASTFVVKLMKIKPGNKRFKGYKIIWG